MAPVQGMTSSEGDRQGLHRQMVVRSNNEYLQVSAQTNETTLVGNDHYQSRTPLSTAGESISREPQYPQLRDSSFVTQFTRMPSPSSDVALKHVDVNGYSFTTSLAL